MNLRASDFYDLRYPQRCDRRVWLRGRGEPEAETGPLADHIRRLGIEHERTHRLTLDGALDIGALPYAERFGATKAAIADRVPFIYQGQFVESLILEGESQTIVGVPDFLVWDGRGYRIRDAKLSTHIFAKPYILEQLAIYGLLYCAATGELPSSFEVYDRLGRIVIVDVDVAAALTDLATVVRLRAPDCLEAYEPVGWSKCSRCGFFNLCWPAAVARHDPALIPGVDQSLARALIDDGVTTYEAVAEGFTVESLRRFQRPHGRGMARVGSAAEGILRAIEAIRRGDAIRLRPSSLPSGPTWIMFDVEGLPFSDEGPVITYLWGTQAFGEASGPYQEAMAPFGQGGDLIGWSTFLDQVSVIRARCGEEIAFVHWSAYERTQVINYIERHGDPDGTASWLLARLFDILAEIKSSIVLPLHSYSLKVVEQFVGFQRSMPQFGSQWSMARYLDSAQFPEERDEAMSEIRRYNEDDLAAMWAVFQYVESL